MGVLLNVGVTVDEHCDAYTGTDTEFVGRQLALADTTGLGDRLGVYEELTEETTGYCDVQPVESGESVVRLKDKVAGIVVGA